MKTRLVQSFAGAAWLACALSSCGPIYNTQYSFTPPKSSEGRACLFQCEHSKIQCRQLEDMRVHECERYADFEQQRCRYELQRQGKKEKWYDCTSDSCSADYDHCDETYRVCYQSCGGEVEAAQVCVANCQAGVPPAPRSSGR